MNSKLENKVRVVHNFKQSAETVFNAWLNPKTTGQWLFATPTGHMVKVEIDPQVGGEFNFTDLREGEEVAHTGEYQEINRPNRLVFTFAVKKYSSVETKVSIDIQSLKEGCELTLTHEGVLPEYMEGTKAGWSGILQKLDSLLAQK